MTPKVTPVGPRVAGHAVPPVLSDFAQTPYMPPEAIRDAACTDSDVLVDVPERPVPTDVVTLVVLDAELDDRPPSDRPLPRARPSVRRSHGP
jgi:hypothetical protein